MKKYNEEQRETITVLFWNYQMIEQEVKEFEEEYMAFMGIDSFPSYALESKKVSLLKADRDGFDSIAQSKYNPEIQEHTLIVADNIIIEPYILFHEFTHILDAETYAKGDKYKYAGLSGYTEYHASQVELLKMLGTNSVKEQISFSSNKMIKTISGIKTVQQYVDEKRTHSSEIFSREEFPKNIEQLKTAIGVLFNFWGLRSICYMYCHDYKENRNNMPFTQYFSDGSYDAMNKIMVGWLSNEIIDISCQAYWQMIYPLILKYKLT